MHISLSQLWSAKPLTIRAQAEKLSNKDPDSSEQDRFLESAAGAEGATRLEKLVALTTREASRQSGSLEATARVNEWGLAALAGGVSGPTGVVLGGLGSQSFTAVSAYAGASASEAVGNIFLERIAKDEGSTPLERTVAASVSDLAGTCGSDSLAAGRIEQMGLGLLSQGVKGPVGQLLGQIGAFAANKSSSAEVQASIGQTLLSRVSSDPGSTPAEAEIARKALLGSNDDRTLAILQLYHGAGASGGTAQGPQTPVPHEELAVTNAGLESLDSAGQRWSEHDLAAHAQVLSYEQRDADRKLADHVKVQSYEQQDADRKLADHVKVQSYQQQDADRKLAAHVTVQSYEQQVADRKLAAHVKVQSYEQQDADRKLADHVKAQSPAL